MEDSFYINMFNSENDGNKNFKIRLKEEFKDFIVKEITLSGYICDYSKIFNYEKFIEAQEMIANFDYEKILTRDERTSLYEKLNYLPFERFKTVNSKICSEKTDKGVFVFTLVKININTMDVAHILSKRLNIPLSTINYSGNKDRHAITFQEFSIECTFKELYEYAVSLFINNKEFDIKEELIKDNYQLIEDMKKYVATSDSLNNNNDRMLIFNIRRGHNIKLGSHLGNSFEILLKDFNKKLENIPSHFLNYYGLQRFGKDQNNHIIGKHLVENNIEEAANLYIKTLDQESKFYSWAISALGNNEEEKNKGGAKRIVKKIARNKLMFYYHAYQSYLFNQEVSTRAVEKKVLENDYLLLDEEDEENFIKVSEFLKDSSSTNKEEDIKFENVYLELCSRKHKFLKGGKRRAVEEIKDFNQIVTNDGLKVFFSLNKSAYATMALREFYYLN